MSKYALAIPCSNTRALDLLTLHVSSPKSRSELSFYLIDQGEDKAVFVLRLWWELDAISLTTNPKLRSDRAQKIWEKYFAPIICVRLPRGCLSCDVDGLISSSDASMLETVKNLKSECLKFVESRIRACASPRDVFSLPS